MIKSITLGIVSLAALVFVANTTMAQAADPAQTVKRKDPRKVNLANRANDHFLLQLGHDSWANKPDSIKTTGFSRSINAYFMLDFPFKTDSRFSVGLGAGVATSTIYFKKQLVNIGVGGGTLRFPNVADTNNYKRYKLLTTYLEAPIELRFTANPENSNKSFKAALGVKIGTIVGAGTKAKTLQTKSGTVINSSGIKEKNRQYFNATRFSATGRIGYGNLTLFGQYQINNLLKDGVGPELRTVSVGITVSGL